MMLSPEMSHGGAAGHNMAEAMLLRGHIPPGFPPSPFAAAATMDHQRVSLESDVIEYLIAQFL